MANVKGMTVEKLVEFTGELAKKNVFYMVLGGFALDGKRGKLTREHQDADILCLEKDEHKVEETIKQLGYVLLNKYGDQYRLRRADGGRLDVYISRSEADKILCSGKNFSNSFPADLMGSCQKANISGHAFTIPPNEMLKRFALGSPHEADVAFGESLPVDEKKMGHIKVIMNVEE